MIINGYIRLKTLYKKSICIYDNIKIHNRIMAKN